MAVLVIAEHDNSALKGATFNAVTAAHWLVIKSFQLAEASVVSPLRYLAIVYAAALGFVVFDGPSVAIYTCI